MVRHGSMVGFWNAMPAIDSGRSTSLPLTVMPPFGRRPQAGNDLHQRRLAAAGWADDGNELAAVNAHRRVLESQRAVAVLAVAQRDVVHIDEVLHDAGFCRIDLAIMA